MNAKHNDFLSLKSGAKEFGCEPHVLKAMMQAGIVRTAYYYDGPVVAVEFWDEDRHDSTPRIATDVWVRGYVFLSPFPTDLVAAEMYATSNAQCSNLGDSEKFEFKFRPSQPIHEIKDDQLRLFRDDIPEIKDRFNVPAGRSVQPRSEEAPIRGQLENTTMMLALLALAMKDLDEQSGGRRYSRGDDVNVQAIVDLMLQRKLNMGVEKHGLGDTTFRSRIDAGIKLLSEYRSRSD